MSQIEFNDEFLQIFKNAFDIVFDEFVWKLIDFFAKLDFDELKKNEMRLKTLIFSEFCLTS